ncbi:MAG: hypothetical protein WD426_08435, partial [Anditalea sp.]
MKIIYKFLILNFIFFPVFIVVAFGQDTEIKITGQVTSEDEPMGLPGTNVLIKGTTQGAVTDMEGR